MRVGVGGMFGCGDEDGVVRRGVASSVCVVSWEARLHTSLIHTLLSPQLC